MLGAVALAAGLLAATAADAQDTIKIGVILTYSGQFADPTAQIDNGIKLYLKQHGDKLGGKSVELIRKDVGGINPPVAKRLAQELVTRDGVDILTGFSLTPNALAGADVSVEAKKFMVVLNAATAIVTTKSPYMVRVSFTVPQLNQTLGTWARQQGLKNAYTMVTDYGPGIDAEAAFQKGFKEAGGDIVGSVRMAVQNPGLFRLRAARQGSRSARHLHHDPGRRAVARFRQGVGRTRHRSTEDSRSWGNWKSPTSTRWPAWATSRSASSPPATTTTITIPN